MDLKTLEDHTDISRTTLRYCLDRKLVPGLKTETRIHETGRSRQFDAVNAFSLICAARLLEAEVRPRVIRRFLGQLLKFRVTGKEGDEPVLEVMMRQPSLAIAHLGDGVYVRLMVPSIEFDSDWTVPDDCPGPVPARYSPTVSYVFDLFPILTESVFSEMA